MLCVKVAIAVCAVQASLHDQNAFELLALAWYAVAGAPPVNAALFFTLCAGFNHTLLFVLVQLRCAEHCCLWCAHATNLHTPGCDCAAGVSMVCCCRHSRCRSVMYSLYML